MFGFRRTLKIFSVKALFAQRKRIRCVVASNCVDQKDHEHKQAQDNQKLIDSILYCARAYLVISLSVQLICFYARIENFRVYEFYTLTNAALAHFKSN